MSEISDIWQIDLGGLLVGSHLAISFQRYPIPTDGVLWSPSPSFGALPIGVTPSGQLQLPIESGEAFWMGFSSCETSNLLVRVAIETPTGELLDALLGTEWSSDTFSGITVPPRRDLDGIVRLAGGLWPLTRSNSNPAAPQCSAIKIVVIPPQTAIPPFHCEDRSITVRIELVSGNNFSKSTGLPSPSPLDITSTYGGWLLP